MKIIKLKAREILDSRGNPTVEADVYTEGGFGRASVPSGASTGMHEAIEKRDGGTRYLGKGVSGAVAAVQGEIASLVVGKDWNQSQLDLALIDLDGTPNKSRLGANALLAVSMAFARSAAQAENKSLFAYIGNLGFKKDKKYSTPTPLMNVINGGAHAHGGLDLQELMIVPYGASSFTEALRWGVEIFHNLKKLLSLKGLPTTVGDEGGFAPPLPGNQLGLDVLMEAIVAAGYTPGAQVGLAIDAAANEFYKEGKYHLTSDKKELTSSQMVDLYAEWASKYPLVSLEDGLAEGDLEGWKELTERLGNKLQLVGDDLFVTDKKRLAQGHADKMANSILIKLNQIGTVQETLDTIALAKQIGYGAIVSHRSGETEDPFISHLAVGTSAGQIKTGSLSRGERTAKYNELLRIEEELGNDVEFAGKTPFKI